MPTNIARIIYGIGILLMVLGLVDALASRVANVDLTGVSWSPMALGLTGILLMWVARMLPQPAE